MNQQANATFRITSWDEQPYDEVDGVKLTRAAVTYGYDGDMEGTGSVAYLMAYRADGSASYVGHERFTGRIGERVGSVVFQHIGAFEGGQATDRRVAVPGTGTGDLRGLQGELSFSAGHEQAYPVTLVYHFEQG